MATIKYKNSTTGQWVTIAQPSGTSTDTLINDSVSSGSTTYSGSKIDSISTNLQGQISTLAQGQNLYSKKQTNLISLFYKKLTRKNNVVGVMQGDSLTYGQDMTSSDRVSPTGTADNGEAHSQPHAVNTIPSVFNNLLNQVYGTSSTIINKGYSGDWVAASLEHWTNNENADFAVLMLGSNDANLGASWVPSSVKGNLELYLDQMRILIERYLDWGTCVFLLTPPRLLAQEDLYSTSGFVLESFRNALFLLGREYNCPIIDSENFLDGCDASYFSDSIHLNSKGYSYFAARLTSVFVGCCNPFYVPQLKSGDVLSVRPTRDNMVYNNVSISTMSSGLGAEENINGQGLAASIPVSGGGYIYWSFETVEDNLIFIPIHVVQTGGSQVSLDFGYEQGSPALLSAVNATSGVGVKPQSIIISTINTNTSNVYDGTINISSTSAYLHITNQGRHTLKYVNLSSASNAILSGFVVMSYKDFILQAKVSSSSSGGTTDDGSTSSGTTSNYTNLLVNGDFESALANWTTNSSFTTSSTVKQSGTLSAAQTGSGSPIYQDVTIAPHTVVYVRCYMYIGGSYIPEMYVTSAGGTSNVVNSVVSSSLTNQWQKVSLIATVPSGTSGLRMWVGKWGNGADCYFDSCIMVDLTSAFGSGSEPTQAWCDANI